MKDVYNEDDVEDLKSFIYNTTAWTDWNCMDIKSKFY